jgi:hypothetical protein
MQAVNSYEIDQVGYILERAATINEPRLLGLKGKYGGRIWMVGNGPSLSQTPLDLLAEKGEYSFGMNAISLIYPSTTWRPSFYMCVSSNTRHPERLAMFMESVDLGIPCFISDDNQGKFPDRENIYWIYSPRSRMADNNTQIRGWSEVCERIVWRYSTSMYLAAQLAVYLGFKELYLLGCDMNWQEMPDNGNDPNHFTASYSVSATPFTPARAARLNFEMEEAHMIMLDIADQAGFKIFNATVGGSLEVYPRVDMQDVLCT